MSEVSKFILEALGAGVSRRSVRLTVRLTNEEFAKLLALVDVMKTSKTALGEKILGKALDEAYATYLETLDENSVDDAVRGLEQVVLGFDLSDEDNIARSGSVAEVAA